MLTTMEAVYEYNFSLQRNDCDKDEKGLKLSGKGTLLTGSTKPAWAADTSTHSCQPGDLTVNLGRMRYYKSAGT